MPLFGSKKKKDKKKEKGADMESSEDDGLFMARGSDAASPEKAAALSLEDGDGEPDPDIQTEDEAPGLSVLDGGPEETSGPAAPSAAAAKGAVLGASPGTVSTSNDAPRWLSPAKAIAQHAAILWLRGRLMAPPSLRNR